MGVMAVVAIGALAAGLGILLGRYLWPTTPHGVREALAKSQAEVLRVGQEAIGLQNEVDRIGAEYQLANSEAKELGKEVARLTERAEGLTGQLTDHAEREKHLNEKLESSTNDVKDLAEQVAQLREREKANSETIGAQKDQLAGQQAMLTTEFENIATRILKTNADELSESSQGELALILDPLRDRIKEFQEQVATTYTAESREVLTLKEQIKTMVETSKSLGSNADSLAKALRGDSQLLGRWGEMALERILEAAGLSEGREYVSQGRGLKLKDEEGVAQKPDIVINLPDQRTLIVDSKVPLTSYDRLIAAKDEREQAACADQVVKDFKFHINGLCGKRYQDNEQLRAHDSVLMFVPLEGALAAALTREPDLFTYAWERHVVLVGPPTLLMSMQTVASIWRYEQRAENAQEIARMASKLCDKVTSSLGDLNSVHEKISLALEAHNSAVKRLSTGKGNVLSTGERIRELVGESEKSMPSMLVHGISFSPVPDDIVESIAAQSDEQ